MALSMEDFLSCRGIGGTCWDEVAREQEQLAFWKPADSLEDNPLQEVRQMLGGRANRVLDSLDVQTMDDVFSLSKDQVTSTAHVGTTTWHEIQAVLKQVAPAAEAVSAPVIDDLSFEDSPLFGGRIAVKQVDLPDRCFPHVSVGELPLSVRCQSVLCELGIRTLGELLCTSGDELLQQANFGEKSLSALQRSIREYMEFRINSPHSEPPIAESFEGVVAQLSAMAGLSLERRRILANRLGLSSFPMKYIPLTAKTRRHVGKHWHRKLIRGVQCVLLATKGMVTPKRRFFEAAFGHDTHEFHDICMMPEHYIIYRTANAEQAKDWRRLYHRLGPNQKQRLCEILAGGPVKPEHCEKEKGSLGKLLDHYCNSR